MYCMIALMKVTPIKTSIVKPHDDLEAFLSAHTPKLDERSVLAVTSKIVALCEGRVVPRVTGERSEKHEIVRQEAEKYLDPNGSQYTLMLTIKSGVMAVNAGVDESNVDAEHYVLLPENSFVSAERIWHWGRKHFKIKEFGVIITDSRTVPLKWGVLGTALGYCGFVGLRNEIGKPDLYGRPMHMTQVNNAEALAVTSVYIGGETAESQPLVLIEDVPQIQFTQTPPSAREQRSLHIKPEEDVYWPIISKADWLAGGSKS